MSKKRWRVIKISFTTFVMDEAGRGPIAFCESFEYAPQHMNEKVDRAMGVRVAATRLTRKEAEAMAKLLNASQPY